MKTQDLTNATKKETERMEYAAFLNTLDWPEDKMSSKEFNTTFVATLMACAVVIGSFIYLAASTF
jgi:FPC/CPF motif-containing protein YcgG